MNGDGRHGNSEPGVTACDVTLTCFNLEQGPQLRIEEETTLLLNVQSEIEHLATIDCPVNSYVSYSHLDKQHIWSFRSEDFLFTIYLNTPLALTDRVLQEE